MKKNKSNSMVTWLTAIFLCATVFASGCLRDCVVTGTVIDVKYMENTGFLSHSSRTILTFSDGRVKVFSTIAKDVILNRPVSIYESRVNNALTFELVEENDG